MTGGGLLLADRLMTRVLLPAVCDSLLQAPSLVSAQVCVRLWGSVTPSTSGHCPPNQEGRLLTHPLSTRSALEIRRAARLCSALDLHCDTVDIYHGMRLSLTTLTGSPRASLVSQKGPSEEGGQTGPLVGEPAPLCPDSGGLIPAGTRGKASAVRTGRRCAERGRSRFGLASKTVSCFKSP